MLRWLGRVKCFWRCRCSSNWQVLRMLLESRAYLKVGGPSRDKKKSARAPTS
jgi:hypothetical protein